MKIITKINELREHLSAVKTEGKSIGFVPTMGALHEGHASLIVKSKAENDVNVVSIFVNPTQFNKLEDFNNYPIKTEDDIKFLEKISCDILFLPTIVEIYPPNFENLNLDIGNLDTIMEGQFRPGHFKGVMEVVHRFFEIIKPTKAYFGLKDYQQVAVIQKMTKLLNLKVEIVPCETIREKDGLAMSSRNLRLDSTQRKKALFIYESLTLAQILAKENNPKAVKKSIISHYQNSELRLEYVEIIDGENFEILEEKWAIKNIICIVAILGGIRLIDNIQLKF